MVDRDDIGSVPVNGHYVNGHPYAPSGTDVDIAGHPFASSRCRGASAGHCFAPSVTEMDIAGCPFSGRGAAAGHAAGHRFAPSVTDADIAGYPFSGRQVDNAQRRWPAAVAPAGAWNAVDSSSGPRWQGPAGVWDINRDEEDRFLEDLPVLPTWVGHRHSQPSSGQSHTSRSAMEQQFAAQEWWGASRAAAPCHAGVGPQAHAAQSWCLSANDTSYAPPWAGAGASGWQQHAQWSGEQHAASHLGPRNKHNGGLVNYSLTTAALQLVAQLVGPQPVGLQRSEDGLKAMASRSDFPARWHKAAGCVGDLSQDDHVFTKKAGPRHRRTRECGAEYEIATICIVFDANLRCGGSHTYRFSFVDGDISPADGAGFSFDTQVRRRPLMQMQAVFLNHRGFICVRKGDYVSRLPVQLPRLTLGMTLTVQVNLDRYAARFSIADTLGSLKGSADVSFESLFGGDRDILRQGFFCAVITGNVTVSLY